MSKNNLNKLGKTVMLMEVIGWVIEKNFTSGREPSNAGKRDHSPSSTGVLASWSP